MHTRAEAIPNVHATGAVPTAAQSLAVIQMTYDVQWLRRHRQDWCYYRVIGALRLVALHKNGSR